VSHHQHRLEDDEEIEIDGPPIHSVDFLNRPERLVND
jgi:hypothetical protein